MDENSLATRRTDVTGGRITYVRALSLPWTQDERAVYAVDPVTGWARMIGSMDTPELAAAVVRHHNDSTGPGR